MEKIGLFYGSDTGNTENIALKIREKISKENVYVIDMYDATIEEFSKYDKIILGLSTWHDGQLQSDWDTFFEEFKEVDFTGKKVALFGLGDIKIDLEVDGRRWHTDIDGNRKVSDIWRDHQLKSMGWKVIRFWVDELDKDMERCIGLIEQELT